MANAGTIFTLFPHHFIMTAPVIQVWPSGGAAPGFSLSGTVLSAEMPGRPAKREEGFAQELYNYFLSVYWGEMGVLSTLDKKRILWFGNMPAVGRSRRKMGYAFSFMPFKIIWNRRESIRLFVS